MAESFTSPNGRADLRIQDDGNVVLYHDGQPVWATHTATLPPTPTPSPTPLPPLVIGAWRANFLFDQFFGPAIAARDTNTRRRYFEQHAQKGYTHVLINAWQDDWGPSRGHPEWTAGGLFAYDSPDHFTQVLIEARKAGLSPIVGLLDREPGGQTWIQGQEARALDLLRRGVQHWDEHTAGWWPFWELDEEGESTWREAFCLHVLEQVSWRGKSVGLHTAETLKGGLDFYGRLGQVYPDGKVVRWNQTPAGYTLTQLVENSRLGAQTAAHTDTSMCQAEHSSQLNQSPTYTESECRARAQACLQEMGKYLAPERYGSLNG